MSFSTLHLHRVPVLAALPGTPADPPVVAGPPQDPPAPPPEPPPLTTYGPHDRVPMADAETEC
ncbi:MAG TPA: hypothetical protein VFH27_07040 [Longimicrobiaceae bacterium]|nr:hypothetical protein [Longimicrobiaceae bacterium]